MNKFLLSFIFFILAVIALIGTVITFNPILFVPFLLFAIVSRNAVY